MEYAIHLFFTSGKDVRLPAVPETVKDHMVEMFMNPPYNSIAFGTPSGTIYVSIDKVEYFTVSLIGAAGGTQ